MYLGVDCRGLGVSRPAGKWVRPLDLQDPQFLPQVSAARLSPSLEKESIHSRPTPCQATLSKLRGRVNTHFVDEETEAGRGEGDCLKPHSWDAAEP